MSICTICGWPDDTGCECPTGQARLWAKAWKKKAKKSQRLCISYIKLFRKTKDVFNDVIVVNNGLNKRIQDLETIEGMLYAERDQCLDRIQALEVGLTQAVIDLEAVAFHHGINLAGVKAKKLRTLLSETDK